MYRITRTDGTELGYADSVNYIKIGESGSFTTATPETAIGIAYNGEPYNLEGHSDIPDADTVTIAEVVDDNEAAHLILNRKNVIIDVVSEVRYLRFEISPVVKPVYVENKWEATGVQGSDGAIHTFISADPYNNPNAVTVTDIYRLPEHFIRGEFYFDEETEQIQPVYNTPAEKREHAYNTLELVNVGGKNITVTDASSLWSYYSSEGSDKAEELKGLIIEAKAQIRRMFPD